MASDALGFTRKVSNALDHGKVASRPRAWCRSSPVGVLVMTPVRNVHVFGLEWWPEDSRVEVVFESFYGIEVRLISFYASRPRAWRCSTAIGGPH